MSDERPEEQDAPTARPSLGDVATWLEQSAQPAPADKADPAPEDETAGPPEPVSEAAAPEDATEPPADAPSPADGVDEADVAGPGALPGSDEPSPIEDEAPPLEPEGAPDGDDHGPPAPAEDGEAGPSNDDAPASEPEEDGGKDPDEGGGTAAPDPGAIPVEAAPVAAGLFELDLAKLAERARASASREAAQTPEPDPAPIPDPIPSPEPLPEPSPPSAPAREPTSAPPDPFPEPVTAPPPTEDEPGQPVTREPAPLVWGEATQAFDLSRDEEDAETDKTEADTAAEGLQGKLFPPAQAAPRAHRAKRPLYPRGQLREPIGVLRRIRAMLGILVVTVILGVAAGTAIGAFIFFLAFAVRNAITSQ